MGSGTVPRDPAGNIINDPPADELPPMNPKEILPAQETSPALDPKYNMTPNPNTPKRYAPDFSRVAPDPKAPRVGDASVSEGDQEFPNHPAAPPPASYLITVTTERVQLAGREPARGWPSYSALYPDGSPTGAIHDRVFNPKNFRNKAADEGLATGTATDPLTSALKAARATLVDRGEFRTLDVNASLLRPLVGRGFQVWELPNRLAADGNQCRNRRLGARLGPHASGIHPRMVFDLDAAPPGIRKAGFRETMEALRYPGQVGYPPSFSVATYQSAEVLFDRCEGVGPVLARLLGTCARTRQGGQKGDMTQRAKVGYRPCCPRPNRVAVPPRYVAGKYSGHEAHGIRLRKEHGPWAVRYFAAAVYARDTGCVPFAWDWATQSMVLKPPTLFGGYFGAERPEDAAFPAQSSQGASEGASRPTLFLSDALPPAPGDISNRRHHPPTQRSSLGNASIPTPPPAQPSVPQPRGGHRRKPPTTPRGTVNVDEAHSDPPAFHASYRHDSPSDTPRVTASEDAAREREFRSRSEHRPPSSYRGNSGAPSNRSSKDASDWRKDWNRGWR